jgi:hypothetical protein
MVRKGIRITLVSSSVGIRDILVRIRMRIQILGSVPLTNGPDADPEGPHMIRIRIPNTGTFTSFFKEKKVIKKL